MARKKKRSRTKASKKTASLEKAVKTIEKHSAKKRAALAALRDRYTPAERKQMEQEREAHPKDIPMTVKKKRLAYLLKDIRDHGG